MVLFALVAAMPGDPLDVMGATGPGISPEALAHLRALYGADDSFAVRYLRWLTALLHGDLGYSRTYSLPVLEVIGPAAVNTLWLVGLSFTISVVLGLLLGLWAAWKAGTWLDLAVSSFAVLGTSVPVFWLALLLIWVFAVQLHWLPASSGAASPDLHRLVLPVITLSLALIGQTTRYVRASVSEALRSDFVRTAFAKGAGPTRVLVVHALPHALITLSTLWAFTFAGLMSGALVTETMFAYRGLGRLIYEAVMTRDFNVAVPCMLLAALAACIASFAAEYAAALLDPRVTQ